MDRSSIATGNTFPLVGSAAITVIVLALFGCAPSDVVREASCPAFAHVDLAALPTHLNDDPADDSFDAAWTRWSERRPDVVWRARATNAAIRLETTDGMVSHPARREVAARRSSQGWEVYARSSSLAGPVINWNAWVPVRISTNTASRLDTLLTDPCLWSAPRYLDGMVRLKNGRYDSRPDGPTTLYDVTAGKQRWGGMQVSWTVGAPGALRDALLTEAFKIQGHSLDEIGPDGWIDKP
jgi:hypothetical protein